MRTSILLGLAGGLLAAVALAFPVHTPTIALASVLAPLAAGAAAAVLRSRREGRELDVDESAYVGGVAGTVGGFVVAVPFPLAMTYFVARPTGPLPLAGGAAAVAIAALLFFAFVSLSVAAAVIAGRVAAR